MFPYVAINPKLKQSILNDNYFDSFRLVDPRNHRIFRYEEQDDDAILQPELCYALWHRTAPCMNCTSKSCRAMQADFIKIEYLEGRVIGVLSVPVEVNGKPYALELIKDVTNSMMIADPSKHDNIGVTQMVNTFNELAVRDTFSTLFNKQYMNNQIENLIEEVKSGVRPRTPDNSCPIILEVDIDDFKHVNDTYGHSVGDDTLLFFSKHLKNLAHSKDGWAARFGGDEFFICIPNGLDEQAQRDFLNRIYEISSHTFVTEKGSFNVNVSCGITELRSDDSVRSAFDRVDEAMYTVKHNGSPQ